MIDRGRSKGWEKGLLLLCGVAPFIAGCSDDPASPPPRPNLASCEAGWQATAPRITNPLVGARAMAWADGTLYESLAHWPTPAYPQAIVAVTTDGGEGTLVARDWTDAMWVDGPNLLYARGPTLLQVPLTGGTPAEVASGDLPPDAECGQRYLLDDSALYCTTISTNSTLWRIPRAGGPAESLGLLGISTSLLASVSDGVLAVGTNSVWMSDGTWNAVVVPSAGGPPRQLDRLDLPFAADAAGVLWNAYTGPADGSRQTYQVRRSPAAGGPAVAPWPQLPAEVIGDWGIPDGAGGYVISGFQTFDDRVNRRSVFALAADGKVTHLACDPSNDMPAIESGALASDAVYLSVNYGEGWQIIKVPRS